MGPEVREALPPPDQAGLGVVHQHLRWTPPGVVVGSHAETVSAGTKTASMALKIGLIADTHIPESRKTLWPQVYDAFQGVDYIFHCGDVHELDLLDELEKTAPVYCARGNGEDGSGGRPVQPEDPRVKYAWTLEMEGLTIGLTHYIPAPERPPDFTVAKWVERFFPDKKPDIIISL